MATELQRQVAILKKNDVSAHSIHDGAPSLFLEAKEAAKVDMREVYRAAVRSIEVLIQYDHTFETYLTSIFHESSMSLQRELRTSTENEVLNSQIREMLASLAFYNSLPAMHTVLEYLLRRYRVHEFNTSDLITCMISQHDTKVLISNCRKFYLLILSFINFLLFNVFIRFLVV
jgi:hypothetical protein